MANCSCFIYSGEITKLFKVCNSFTHKATIRHKECIQEILAHIYETEIKDKV